MDIPNPIPEPIANNKKPRSSLRRCCVTECNNTASGAFSLFKFPKEVERCRTWLTKCDRFDLWEKVENLHRMSWIVLCGAHFKADCFKTQSKNRLSNSAIPTLFTKSEMASSSAASTSMFEEVFMEEEDYESDENKYDDETGINPEMILPMPHDINNAEIYNGSNPNISEILSQPRLDVINTDQMYNGLDISQSEILSRIPANIADKTYIDEDIKPDPEILSQSILSNPQNINDDEVDIQEDIKIDPVMFAQQNISQDYIPSKRIKMDPELLEHHEYLYDSKLFQSMEIPIPNDGNETKPAGLIPIMNHIDIKSFDYNIKVKQEPPETEPEPVITKCIDEQYLIKKPDIYKKMKYLRNLHSRREKTANQNTQTTQRLSAYSPRKLTLRDRIKRFAADNSRLRARLIELEDISSSTVRKEKKEIKRGINNLKRNLSHKFKKYSLFLYFTAPKIYKNTLVAKHELPDTVALRRFAKSVIMFPGLNDTVFKLFKKKASYFEETDKLCTLCIGETKLNPRVFYGTTSDSLIGLEDRGNGRKEFRPARVATMITARGICSNWHQPLACFLINSKFPSGELREILMKFIARMKEINLKVVAVVADMKPNCIQLAEDLKISAESPYFRHENQDISFIFDVPHLLSALKNSFIKCKFLVNENAVLWEHVKSVYFDDKRYPKRAMPKLTDNHLRLGAFSKRQARNAAQVFSSTVASTMNLYIRFGELPSEAKATEEFIKRINDLFDTLNSNTNQTAFKGSAEQMEFLQECYDIFDDLSKSFKGLSAWKITLKAFFHLWNNIKAEGVKLLFTRRLNQDYLQDFFALIKKQSGRGLKPTPIRFMRAYRNFFAFNLIYSGVKKLKGCNKDLTSLLDKFSNYQQAEIQVVVKEPEFDDFKTIPTDYRTDDLLRSDFKENIAGFLVNKCTIKHCCLGCEEITLYSETRHNFEEFVTCLELMFENHLETVAVKSNFLVELMNVFNIVNFNSPCQHFPYTFAVKLYARAKIFYTVKRINENFKLAKNNECSLKWRFNCSF